MTRFASLLIAVGLVAALLVSCGMDQPAGIVDTASVTLSIAKEAAIDPDHYTISVQGDGVALDTTGASGDTVWLQLSPGAYQFDIRAYDTSDRLCGAASFSYDVTEGTHVIPVTLVAVPQIVDQPDDAAVTAGETASFAIGADGSDLGYQWQRDGADIDAATDSVYEIAATEQGDSGAAFRCIVTNTVGADTSREAVLEVLASISAPQITAEPADVQVEAGDSASFAVSADGPGLSYQWQRDGADITGADDSVYALEAGGGDSGAVFRCIVANSAGADTSREAMLEVSDTAGPVAPAIESHPEPVTVTVGETATFVVSAGGTDLSYQWQRDGADIGSTDDSVYSFAVSAADHETRYRCIVTNSVGSDTSAEAPLRVFAADSLIDTLLVTAVDTLTDTCPYHVTGAIIVEEGGVLVIEAGAYVKMGEDVAMTVSGELRCEGTEARGITFTAYDTSACWAYVELKPEAVDAVFDAGGAYQSGCVLQHTTVEYAEDFGLYISDASVSVDNCTFRFNGVGVYQGGECGSRFEECTVIDNNKHGLKVEGTWGASRPYSVVVLRSVLAQNFYRGIDVVLSWKVLIDSCSIYGNQGGGIRIYRTDTSTISNCTIADNRDEDSPYGGGGIEIQHTDSCVVRDNLVSNNTTPGCGGGICCDGGASGRRIVVHNLFVGNRAPSGAGGCFNRPDSIAYNTFYGNTPLSGGDSSALSFHHKILLNDPETSFMHNNVVEHEAAYAVRNTNEDDERVLNLRQNWWGTTDEGEIEAMIFHHDDGYYDVNDSTYYQQADFSGYLDAPEPGAPEIPGQ